MAGVFPKPLIENEVVMSELGLSKCGPILQRRKLSH